MAAADCGALRCVKPLVFADLFTILMRRYHMLCGGEVKHKPEPAHLMAWVEALSRARCGGAGRSPRKRRPLKATKLPDTKLKGRGENPHSFLTSGKLRVRLTACLHISRGSTFDKASRGRSPPACGLPDDGTQGSRRARAEGLRTRGDRGSCPRARHLPERRRPPRPCAGRMGATAASPAYPRHASSCSSS